MVFLLVGDCPPDSFDVPPDSIPATVTALPTDTDCVTLDLLESGHIVVLSLRYNLTHFVRLSTDLFNYFSDDS